MWFAVTIIIVLLILLYFSRFIPSKEHHVTRNRFNKLPVGTLRMQQGSNYTFVDSAGTVWIRRPYIMSLAHEPSTNYVFETYDPSTPTSSEAVADKSLFDNGRQVFTEGSFNFNSPFQNPVAHIFSDVLPSFLYS